VRVQGEKAWQPVGSWKALGECGVQPAESWKATQGERYQPTEPNAGGEGEGSLRPPHIISCFSGTFHLGITTGFTLPLPSYLHLL